MADLKTNYKDDVLDTSVNEKRKFKMIQNEDGTVSFEDVTEYTQTGDSFGAADFNATNTAVNEVNSNLSTVVLPITSIDNAIVGMSEWSEFSYNDFMATVSLYAIMSVDGTNSIVSFGSENAPKRTTILNVQKLSGQSTSAHAYIDTNGILIVGDASANDYLLITGTWFKK